MATGKALAIPDKLSWLGGIWENTRDIPRTTPSWLSACTCCGAKPKKRYYKGSEALFCSPECGEMYLGLHHEDKAWLRADRPTLTRRN